jgi:hypothetical protein
LTSIWYEAFFTMEREVVNVVLCPPTSTHTSIFRSIPRVSVSGVVHRILKEPRSDEYC